MRTLHGAHRVSEETFERVRDLLLGQDENVAEVFDEMVDEFRPALLGMTHSRLVGYMADTVLGRNREALKALYSEMSAEELQELVEDNTDALEDLADQKAREARFLRDLSSSGFSMVMGKLMSAIITVVAL